MPALENLDWERFCQAFVHGETANNATRSYALVYRTENLDSARSAAARNRRIVSALLRPADQKTVEGLNNSQQFSTNLNNAEQ